MPDKLRILVVDDSRAITVFVSDTLTANLESVEVIAVSDGLEALKIALSRPLDLIISDWNMPQINGRILLERVRADERNKDVPFIMLTGKSDQESVVSAISLGVSAYLIKPFTPESLLKHINTLISKRPPPQK